MEQTDSRNWARDQKAEARLRMIQHHKQVTYNVSHTCWFFDISRSGSMCGSAGTGRLASRG